MSKKFNILVTGGAGFIGSALCRGIIRNTKNNLIILDKLTYASDLKSLESIIYKTNVSFIKGSIGDKKIVDEILVKYSPQYIFNLAAETHVDNSISNPKSFINTNIIDTFNFLEMSLKYYKNIEGKKAKLFKFLQISTDEVYGDILLSQRPVKETAAYNPSSPYSATKAAGDHLIKVYFRTFGFPALITNCCNNYGPFQNQEKFIPVIINNILKHKQIPVYGDGKQIREWIFVDDHCDALMKLADNGIAGQNYNIGNGNRVSNLQLIEMILKVLKNKNYLENIHLDSHISFIKDRLGHDRKYAINSEKIKRLCDWKAKTNFEKGLKTTVDFFIK